MGSTFFKFADGPLAEHPPVMNTQMGWPPPERLEFGGFDKPTGYPLLRPMTADDQRALPESIVYKKIRQSGLPDDIDHPGIMRGAEYQVET